MPVSCVFKSAFKLSEQSDTPNIDRRKRRKEQTTGDMFTEDSNYLSIRLFTRVVPASMYFHCGNIYGTILADLNEKRDKTADTSFTGREYRLLTAHIVPIVEHRPRKVTRSVVKWKAM